MVRLRLPDATAFPTTTRSKTTKMLRVDLPTLGMVSRRAPFQSALKYRYLLFLREFQITLGRSCISFNPQQHQEHGTEHKYPKCDCSRIKKHRRFRKACKRPYFLGFNPLEFSTDLLNI